MQKGVIKDPNGSSSSSEIQLNLEGLKLPEHMVGEEYFQFVLKTDLCLPGQKVESVMRQCLNCVFNKK